MAYCGRITLFISSQIAQFTLQSYASPHEILHSTFFQICFFFTRFQLCLKLNQFALIFTSWILQCALKIIFNGCFFFYLVIEFSLLGFQTLFEFYDLSLQIGFINVYLFQFPFIFIHFAFQSLHFVLDFIDLAILIFRILL